MPKIASLILLILLLAPVAVGEESEPDDAPAWTTAQRDAALKKAFAYLDDNLWKLGDRGSPFKQYSAAVAGWAYLLAGQRSGERLPSRGKQLHRIRAYLERRLEPVERLYERFDRDGRVLPSVKGGVANPGMAPEAQFTWPLSMAAFFFAESLARGKDERDSRSMLERVVVVLERAQQPNGGWGHDDAQVPGLGMPESRDIPGGYPQTLVGATNCAASALGTAYRLLNLPDPESAPLAIRYYREAQNPDGTFPYDPSRKVPARLPAPGDRDVSVIARARTAGALFALYCLGAQADEDLVTKAAAVVEGSLEDVSEGHGSATLALQFGALLSRAQGAERWKAFRTIYFPPILDEQYEDGSFGCVCMHEAFGVICDTKPRSSGLGTESGYRERAEMERSIYVTAIHCLILLLDRAPSRCAPEVPAAKGPVTPR